MQKYNKVWVSFSLPYFYFPSGAPGMKTRFLAVLGDEGGGG
jgi:hypothetical protein